MVITALPAAQNQLQLYRKAQEEDLICSQVIQYCKDSWPGKHSIYPELRPYWENRASLTFVDDILIHGCCIVVPKSLQKETLSKNHQGNSETQNVSCKQGTPYGGQEYHARLRTGWDGAKCVLSTLKPIMNLFSPRHFQHIPGKWLAQTSSSCVMSTTS